MANLLSTTVNGQLNTGNVIDLGYTVNGSISTTEFRGINFHAFSDLNYYIGKPAGAWTQPLHIHFYTGIWLRSHQGYGGTRFYNIASGSQLMSIGDGGDSINVYTKITSSVGSGTVLSHASMDDAIGWNASYGTYIGSTVGGTYYIYGNGTFYDNGTIRTLIHSGNIGSQSVSYASSAGNSSTVGGRSVGNEKGNVGYFDSNGNLFIYNPESYTGEVRLGAAWNRGGVYAEGILSLSTNGPQIDFVFGNSTRAFFAPDGNLWMSWAGTYLSTLLDGKASTSHTHDDRYYTEGESDAKYLIGTTNPNSVANFLISIGNNGSYSYVQSHAGQPLYLNPLGNSIYLNSTTYLNGNEIYSVGNIFNNGWYRNYGKQGIYNQDYGTHFYSNQTNAWSITGSGGNIELQFRSNHESTLRGWVYANTSNEIGFLSEDGNWVLRTWNRGVEAYGSMRAPIFYDSNDTNYYVDPNGASKLNGLHIVSSGNQVSGYDASLYIGGNNNDWGITVGKGSYDYGINVEVSGSATYAYLSPNFRVSGAGAVYSTILYDSNDANYYLDLNSSGTSLKVAGNIDVIARSASWAEGIKVSVPSTSTWGGIRFTRERANYDGNWAIGFTGIDSTDDLTFWGNTGGNSAMRMRLDHSSNLIAYGSMRAPIFYDSNDTGYYADFNSTSNESIRVRGGMLMGPNPTWGAYLQIGGNGHENGERASVVATNGNLHLDPAAGYATYLNYYTNADIRIYGTSYHNNWSLQNVGSLALNNGFTISQGVSNYGVFNSWVHLPGTHGFYSAVNNAHFYPNNASYGPWRIDGTRGGWNGITFSANNGHVALMIDPSSSTIGFHNESYGWQFYWESGTIYCNKNSYGGGPTATVLDSSNYSSYALPLSGGTVTGTTEFNAVTYPLYARSYGNTADVSAQGLQVYSSGGTGAIMAFHRGGYYAVNMGLDSDNVIRIGGWSAGPNLFQMDMSGNLTMKGDVIAFSDARVKRNIQTIEGALEKTLKLRGVTYNRIDTDDATKKLGVIAQEVLEVIPEAVSLDNNGTYGVSYGNLVGLLIEAIKEQQAQIDELKSKLDGITK